MIKKLKHGNFAKKNKAGRKNLIKTHFKKTVLSRSNCSDFEKIDTVVLVRITDIKNNVINVKLANNRFGTIDYNQISNTYNQIMKDDSKNIKPLDEMFTVGENIYARIINNLKPVFVLSMIPNQVHKDITCGSVCKGLIFRGSVMSVDEENEIYTIETGIQHLHATLSESKALTKHKKGDTVLCAVKNISNSIFASTATLKELSTEELNKLKLNVNPSLISIIPGVLVKFKIEKRSTDDGMFHGTLFHGTIKGVANISTQSIYEIGEQYFAIVLCVSLKKDIVFLELEFNAICEDIKAIKRIHLDKNTYKAGDYVSLDIKYVDSEKIAGTISGTDNNSVIFINQLSNSLDYYKVSEKVNARVINKVNDRLFLTNRLEYLRPDAKILTNYEDAIEKKIYLGTVYKEFDNFYVIQFFNGITGTISKSKHCNEKNLFLWKIDYFEIINTKVNESKNYKNIILKFPENFNPAPNLGTVFQNCVIINRTNLGLEIAIDDKVAGIVPTNFLSNDFELSKILQYKFRDGDSITCVNFNEELFSFRDSKYYQNNTNLNFIQIDEGDIITGFVRSIMKNLEIEIYFPLLNLENKTMKVKFETEDKLKFYYGQPILAKVLHKNSTSILSISTDLLTLWSEDYYLTAKHFIELLNEYKYALYLLKNQNDCLGNFNIGSKVKGTVIKILDEDIEIDVGNGVFGIAKKTEQHAIGDVVSGFVIWINVPKNFVNITLLKINKISADNLPETIVANKLLSTNKLFVSQCLKTGRLILTPKYVHPNDFIGNLKYLKDMKTCTFRCIDCYDGNIIGIPEQSYIPILNMTNPLKRKTKLDLEAISNKKHNSDTLVEDKKKNENAVDIENEDDDDEDETKLELPTMSNFWFENLKSINNDNFENNRERDDDDDNDDLKKEASAKKKLSAAEKREAFKAEESRLREIEVKLADPTHDPNSIDQFDRLAMSSPNDSIVWIKYMSFHLASTEIEKARAVARLALKTISFREETEKLNVWVALLNLEIRYGNDESFKSVLEEALKVNDQYKIYCKCLEVYVSCKKLNEVKEIMDTMKKKFKTKYEMWLLFANSYFAMGENERAKNLLGRALMSIDEKEHVHTITQFAILMNKFNESESAHVHLEQILSSYPKRVDIWSLYVDMLLKSNNIEAARGTLDRAVSHKLPLKKMRPLFKKYLDFEMKHGDETRVAYVKNLAESCVSSVVKNLK